MSQQSTRSLCIKLCFEEKDKFVLYKWHRAVTDAIAHSRSRTTPFTKAQAGELAKMKDDDYSDFSDDDDEFHFEIAKGFDKSHCTLDG